jgi:tRNA modification GTPase
VFATDDTIVAIATPPGRGGIGVVRLSGPQALDVARPLITHAGPLEPRRATFTLARLDEADGRPLDEALVTYFAAPASYTGEDVVELSVHGSPVVLEALVAAAVRAGARLAEPGEFTLRAHLNGRLNLMQAEAVADLIDAVTPLQVRAAFDQLQGTSTEAIAGIDSALFDLIAGLEASVDFPEEGYHFVEPASLAARIMDLVRQTDELLASGRRRRLVREGFQVAIVGAPNVGKSSLFNALIGSARAIVTDVPGTTRDLLTETVDLEGFRVTLVDTAGLRATDDLIEAEGVARAVRASRVADLVLLVLDGSCGDGPPVELEPRATGTRRIVVQNKSDLGVVWSAPDAIQMSAKTGVGLELLRRRILASLDVEVIPDRPAIANVRHLALLETAQRALQRAVHGLEARQTLPEEFVLADLQEARAALEEITGRRTPDDVLAHIFARFCIGK